MSVSQEIIFLSDTSKRFGTLADCSESGMFIRTMSLYPFESAYDVLIPRQKDVLIIPVKVVRAVKSGNFYEGMGVQLADSQPNYLKFVTSRRQTRS